MKKSTKALIIIYIIVLIPSLIFGRYVFRGIIPTGDSFKFNFDLNGIIGIILNVISMILGTVLFFKFLNSVSTQKAIFFSSAPLVIVYGLSMFLLAQLTTYENDTALTVRAMLNITAENRYNTILWAVLITLAFIGLLFLNFFVFCKPINKMEKIVVRLGDGKVKNDRFKIGGGKQFHNIEHGLNKINNNYREKDKSLKEFNLEAKKYIPKEFFKFLGKSSIAELELGHEVKKRATTLQIKLEGINNRSEMNLEESFNFLNSYIHVVSPLITKFNGFVDKFLGEGLVAVFSSSSNAIDCAHAVNRAIEIKNRQHKTLPNIKIRITLISGEVVFGIIGDEDRKIPTIVSGITKDLERLDEIAKLISAKIVLGKSILDDLPLNFKFSYRHIGEVSLSKGKNTQIFEDLEAYPRDQETKYIRTRKAFERGVILYTNGSYKEARECFEEVIRGNGEDKCAYVYFNKTKDKLAIT